MAEGKVVFRGDGQECLKHFSGIMDKRFPKFAKGAEQSRKPLADFCGVAVSTVHDWLKGLMFPRDPECMKLLCFLEIQGYMVSELEKMSRTKRNLVELMVFGVHHPDELVEKLGYANRSILFAMLRSDTDPQKDKSAEMWDLWKLNKETLEAKKAEARKQYFLSDIFETIENANQPTPPVKEKNPVAPVSEPEDEIFDIMKGLLKALDRRKKSGVQLMVVNGQAQIILRLAAHFSELSATIIRAKKE